MSVDTNEEIGGRCKGRFLRKSQFVQDFFLSSADVDLTSGNLTSK